MVNFIANVTGAALGLVSLVSYVNHIANEDNFLLFAAGVVFPPIGVINGILLAL